LKQEIKQKCFKALSNLADKKIGTKTLRSTISVTISLSLQRTKVWFGQNNMRPTNHMLICWIRLGDFNCSFEQGLCPGWRDLATSDNFDWLLNAMNTPTQGTGPSFDHTMQNKSKKISIN